MFIFKQV